MTLRHITRFVLRRILPCLFVPATGLAAMTPADLCRQAANAAADRSGVPYAVLMALSVVETGRDGEPWPWTVNIAGEGYWLDTADAAADLAEKALDQGLTNVDLGCFQLNLRWHAGSFYSVEDMLDPERNALYAANYLASLFTKTGDWALAAAAYHSSRSDHADRYRARFEAALQAQAESPLSHATGGRMNRYPLLVAGQSGGDASLMPGTKGGSRLIGGP